ncbi:ParB/RepB/Spo0J family partition protein [Kitasatospora sp. NPDC048239]|uniref:ParB/RepB/Spo0J family partition protein n=1 Tax=Kitasatospora sp. NPDC048239 TaxID=3364046 RepID=UPI003713D1B4
MEGRLDTAVLGLSGDGAEEHATESVPIASLRSADSPRLQAEDPDHVQVLAQSDAPLPPIVVHRSSMRVIDGMHRVHAARLRGAERIDVRFVEGDEKDLFLLAVRLNVTHGLPLSLADRRAAVARILVSHPQWSDRAIAEATGLAAKAVGAMRQEPGAEVSTLQARIGRDGKRRPLSSAEGRRSAGELVKADPQTPLRRIAREAGISLGTASDVRARVLRGEDPVPQPRLRGVPAAGGTEAAAVLPQSTPAAPTVERRSQRDVAMAMRILVADPSLRFTDAGRNLLRWLGGHVIEPDEWQTVVETVPSHCVGTVADLAHRCSDSWREFAKQLEQRHRASA